ncbi:mannitol dehydrogenase family protein [Spiribacter onubensis]|uniref:Mannitol dehydrogenase family protein n=1 Tax=Spiribacter onubensis TaxID=3122420 RepID=A0ABV3S9A8_9GAMM
MTVRLSENTLSCLPGDVARPGYDRQELSAGIFHFGMGNFHRAHLAAYLDELMNRGLALDWGIVGGGVRPEERAGRAVLADQQWLSTLVEQSATVSRARVIGSMLDFVPPGEGAAIIERLSRPDIRIVSLTITEGGYFLDADDRFDASHPDLLADAEAPESPRTVFGLILAALRVRRDAGTAPFTVMSCDNIPHNGDVTRGTLTGLARLQDPAFAEWVAGNVAFPNGMVDRITPATTDRERRLLADEFGVTDGWPVFCEDFRQWVLEDRFPLGRPPLEQVGVQFVEDVSPFETMKLRILNAGHATIAYPAGLLGIEYVHEAMADERVGAFLERLEQTEIIPRVPAVPGIALDVYFSEIRRRFANPKIGDTIRRLCLDGSNRQPKFIVPIIRDAIADGGSLEGLALESALWCRYCAGETDAGAPIEPNDPHWETLRPIAAAARTEPARWLAQTSIYGGIGDDARFAEAFAGWLDKLWRRGTAATLEAYLQ